MRIASTVALLLAMAHLWSPAGKLHAQSTLRDRASARVDAAGNVAWYDIRALGLEGQGWTDIAAPFDRLPARAEKMVRKPVWDLSRHSAGLCVRFVTDATEVSARWKLRSDRIAMPHMPATGVSGLDLYARNDAGRWQWLAVGQPRTFPDNEAVLVKYLPPGRREFLLYLPLYNGVDSVELGVAANAAIAKAPRRSADKKAICFYGTSIMQGGCASRPGMAHAAILGRWLDRPSINLGFSGNGKMDIEVAELLAELDPALYVIDCLPNMFAADVAERTAPLVRKLRAARPKTPILLVEDRTYTNAPFLPKQMERHAASRAALRAAYQQLLSEGVKRLHYLEGEDLLGNDREDTVDGSHPTDLGFMRMAERMRPVIEALLAE